MIPKKHFLRQYTRSKERSFYEDTSTLYRVAELFELDPIRKCRPAGDGFASKTYILTTEQGKWALKQYRKQIQPQEISFIHSLLIQLEQQNFPISHLNLTPDDQDYVTMDNYCYALFDYEIGYRSDLFFMTKSLRQRHIKQAGGALGCLHRLTTHIMPRGQRNQGYKTKGNHERWDSYDSYPIEWSELISPATRKNKDLPISDTTLRRIEDKLADLVQKENQRVLLPISIIHGDYGPWNLLFKPLAILNSIIDFDDAHYEERLEEVAACVLRFAAVRSKKNLDIDDARVFLESYHQQNPLSSDELQSIHWVLERYLLKRVLTIMRRYVVCSWKGDDRKLQDVVFWLEWLDLSGSRILQDLAFSILDSTYQH